MKSFLLLVLLWTIQANLLVNASNSLPNKSLTLETHPEGLTCTLYMRLITLSDTDLWEKLIFDNKDSRILSLITSPNKTTPEPDINFLEQCTVNLIVGNDYLYTPVASNLHSARSSYHSTFIIVSNAGCDYFEFF